MGQKYLHPHAVSHPQHHRIRCVPQVWGVPEFKRQATAICAALLAQCYNEETQVRTNGHSRVPTGAARYGICHAPWHLGRKASRPIISATHADLKSHVLPHPVSCCSCCCRGHPLLHWSSDLRGMYASAWWLLMAASASSQHQLDQLTAAKAVHTNGGAVLCLEQPSALNWQPKQRRHRRPFHHSQSRFIALNAGPQSQVMTLGDWCVEGHKLRAVARSSDFLPSHLALFAEEDTAHAATWTACLDATLQVGFCSVVAASTCIEAGKRMFPSRQKLLYLLPSAAADTAADTWTACLGAMLQGGLRGQSGHRTCALFAKRQVLES